MIRLEELKELLQVSLRLVAVDAKNPTTDELLEAIAESMMIALRSVNK